MNKLIEFIKENYPTAIKEGVSVSFLKREDDYIDIAVMQKGKLRLMNKFIYQSSKGEYIRALTKPNHYIRIYLGEVRRK